MGIIANSRHKKGEGNIHHMEVKNTSLKNMIKAREEELPDIEREIEKVLSNYDGGAITIIMNTHDETGETTGHQQMTIGAESLKGLVYHAFYLEQASNHTVADLTDTLGKEDLSKILTSIVGEFAKDHGKD